LDFAPIISSYTVAEVNEARPGSIDLDVRAEEQTDGILRLYGTAIPDGYDPEEYYEIFVRIDGADHSGTYVTFPILEPVIVEQSENPETAEFAENAAFSARLDLSELPAGLYEISIIVKGENETLITPYLSIQRP
jgi:hypothetical protein